MLVILIAHVSHSLATFFSNLNYNKTFLIENLWRSLRDKTSSVRFFRERFSLDVCEGTACVETFLLYLVASTALQ